MARSAICRCGREIEGVLRQRRRDEMIRLRSFWGRDPHRWRRKRSHTLERNLLSRNRRSSTRNIGGGRRLGNRRCTLDGDRRQVFRRHSWRRREPNITKRWRGLRGGRREIWCMSRAKRWCGRGWEADRRHRARNGQSWRCARKPRDGRHRLSRGPSDRRR